MCWGAAISKHICGPNLLLTPWPQSPLALAYCCSFQAPSVTSLDVSLRQAPERQPTHVLGANIQHDQCRALTTHFLICLVYQLSW